MFKKAFIVLFCAVFILSVYLLNAEPVFDGEKIEVYTVSGSSNALIKTVDKYEYLFLPTVKGDSVRLNADGFDVLKLLNDYDAKMIMIERLDGVECYYAYSSKIRYREIIGGKRVNLQIAVRGEIVTVGSPIIYGSF